MWCLFCQLHADSGDRHRIKGSRLLEMDTVRNQVTAPAPRTAWAAASCTSGLWLRRQRQVGCTFTGSLSPDFIPLSACLTADRPSAAFTD